MRNKSLVLLLACVFGTIAAIGISQWMQANSAGQSSVETVEIFVTSKTIDIAERITAESIRLEQWPADRVPQGASGKLEDLEGKYARQRFYEGEPVMPVKLMDDANGSSQTIPVGYSVVSMAADSSSSVASLLRPGDRVDVTAYFTKGELIPETTAKTVLTGVRVFAIDGRTERDTEDDAAAGPARSISLLINKKDTPAWTYASELGKIRLTLGNPGDVAALDPSGNQAGQDFLKWLADHQIAQAERERLSKIAPPVAAPQSVTYTSTEPAARKGFEILKMSNGVLTKYWIEEGTTVPVIVSETPTGPSAAPAAPTQALDGYHEMGSGADVPGAPTDYSYLNGSQSPFYQPPRGQNDNRNAVDE